MNKDIIVIDDIYIDNQKPLKCTCSNGHIFYMTWSSLQNPNKTCKFCKTIKFTHPHLLKYFLNKEDSEKYKANSHYKIDLVCPECHTIKKNAYIGNLTKHGFSCSMCSDGISFPNKVIRNLLNYMNIDFIPEYKIKGYNYSYDVYVPYLNLIIEMHGKQHYNEILRGRSLQEEQENDKLKYELTIQNGINYVAINCSDSDFEYIKNNLICELSKYLDLKEIDWDYINIKSLKSTLIEACNIFNDNDGKISTVEIGKILKLDRSVIRRYLKIGSKLGLCNYNAQEARMNAVLLYLDNTRENRIKPVVQLDKNGKILNEFDSVSSASMSISGKYNSHISDVCKGKRKTALGYKWMYKTDSN